MQILIKNGYMVNPAGPVLETVIPEPSSALNYIDRTKKDWYICGSLYLCGDILSCLQKG